MGAHMMKPKSQGRQGCHHTGDDSSNKISRKIVKEQSALSNNPDLVQDEYEDHNADNYKRSDCARSLQVRTQQSVDRDPGRNLIKFEFQSLFLVGYLPR